MFRSSLQDLVKGIRNHKRDQATYISKAIVDIKQELQSTDVNVKAVAVQKVTYLQMLGYDVSFASFHIIEIMSSARYAHKRIGMLASTQVFDINTDVILLCTNLFKKDLQSKNVFETCTALNCLSNIVTPDLARDLLDNVAALMSSSRSLIRKRAILCLYKIYLQYPEGLKRTYDRLRARLEDDDPSVVSCAVNVICELSRKNPKNFLFLVPQLFQILTSSSNNWMLIKVVKLLSALLPEEPRLAKKIISPLTVIISKTSAKSLLYECVHTTTLAFTFLKDSALNDSFKKTLAESVNVCTVKLREFIEDSDQNLKYLGLVGLVSLMKSHPHIVAEHKDLILNCLLDDDLTVRMRALELLTGLVTKQNLVDIVQKLLEHVRVAEGVYLSELIDKIIFICNRDRYSYLSNFEWYITVLVDLIQTQSNVLKGPGPSISYQLLDVTARVPSVRAFAAKQMVRLLLNDKIVCQAHASIVSGDDDRDPLHGDITQVLYAAAWIACEYSALLDVRSALGCVPHRSSTIDLRQLARLMLNSKTMHLAPAIQTVYIHGVLKLVRTIVASDFERLEEQDVVPYVSSLDAFVAEVVLLLRTFTFSEHIEVQHRAAVTSNILSSLCFQVVNSADLEADLAGRHQVLDQSSSRAKLDKLHACLSMLFQEEYVPVNVKAQKRVPLPDNLDLDKPIFKHGNNNRSYVNKKAGLACLLVRFEKSTAPSASLTLSHQREADRWLSEQETKHSYSSTADSTESASVTYTNPKADHPFYLRSSSASAPVLRGSVPATVDDDMLEGYGIPILTDIKQAPQPALVLDDVMPENALSSDDDSDCSTDKSHEITLCNIDITVDDISDREPPAKVKAAKKHKKHKKDKKSKKHKKDKKHKKQQQVSPKAAEGNLLEF